jgi:hypothetical protein
LLFGNPIVPGLHASISHVGIARNQKRKNSPVAQEGSSHKPLIHNRFGAEAENQQSELMRKIRDLIIFASAAQMRSNSFVSTPSREWRDPAVWLA